ncbi:hypothetical protein LCGC14_1809660, partial [marine sediment metagenome]
MRARDGIRFVLLVMLAVAAGGCVRHRAPRVVEISVPDTPGGNAIFGAIGRDSGGHVWFAVSAKHVEDPSAHLFEYDPASGKLIDRGDVVSAMKQCGVYRPGDRQMKIHSRIVQAADGHMYFSSMDEEGEDVSSPDETAHNNLQDAED